MKKVRNYKKKPPPAPNGCLATKNTTKGRNHGRTSFAHWISIPWTTVSKVKITSAIPATSSPNIMPATRYVSGKKIRYNQAGRMRQAPKAKRTIIHVFRFTISSSILMAYEDASTTKSLPLYSREKQLI